MSRWNHYAEVEYKPIEFSTLKIGDKFRKGVYRKGGKIGSLIICIKTGDLEYQEFISKEKKTLLHTNGFMVYSLDKTV